MTASLNLGIIGDDRRAHRAAVRFSPALLFSTPRINACLSGPFERWREVVTDPEIDAVLVGHADRDADGLRADGERNDRERARVVAAALESGKAVLCPTPMAMDRAGLEQIEAALRARRGLLVAPGEIAHTPAGGRALALAAGGELGQLHSIYLAIRRPAIPRPLAEGKTTSGVLHELGWDALDYVLTCAGAPARRVYATTARLFRTQGDTGEATHGDEDTALLTIRFANDVIATVELARSLPPALPAAGLGEVEADIVGAAAAVRIEPYNTAVRVYGKARTRRRPWLPDPVVSMLDELAAAVNSGRTAVDYLGRARALVELMEAIRRSAATGDAVTL